MNAIKATLSAPHAPRAMLVTLGRNGQINSSPVQHGQSVLNIKDELIDHLNEYPHSSEFLEDLRDYCTARLAARQEAKATAGLSIHRGNVFSIEHANLFQPLN